MRVGVGLPNSIPGMPAERLIEWAQRAEELDFSTLGVVDRIAYQSFEPLTALAVAATTTQHIGLATVILIGPLRNNAVLAKEAATVNAISGGRLTLGLAVGARVEDYNAAGVSHRRRGERLSDQLADLRTYFSSEGFGLQESPAGQPALLVGGTSDLAFKRMANHSDGYVHGGGPPRVFENAATTAYAAWVDAGRPGRPLLWGQGYFALGPDAKDRGLAYMLDYYSFVGPFAQRIAEGLLTTPLDVVQFVRGYSEEGCDELVLMPAVSELEQLDRLADVLSVMR
jgi:alkanesulfonate monooxygenase SsuD/methylene tetrahydromethanopterin reductase-like flavin-dependent oxidoreductase (luciferase family)